MGAGRRDRSLVNNGLALATEGEWKGRRDNGPSLAEAMAEKYGAPV